VGPLTLRPQVADRGEGPQICKEAANLWNKQTRVFNNGWSSSLGFGRGVKRFYTVTG
jgi:hypothetical protein